MLNFEFYNPTRYHFGESIAFTALDGELKNFGKTVLLAYGCGSIKKNGVYERVKEILLKNQKTVIELSGIMPNPTYEKVLEGIDKAKQNKVDLVLAVGGGSVIDCAKVVALGALCEGDLWETIFTKNILPTKHLPFGSIVTAFGTGAESNGHGVITNEKLGRKTGVKGAIPSFAILDPLMTLSVPKEQVFSGAFDCLNHAYESFLSTPCDNVVSDKVAIGVMRSVIENTLILKDDFNNVKARGELMWASVLAICGLLKSGKNSAFQVHQLEHQLGAFTDCNHGQGLAVLHPRLYRKIYKKCSKQLATLAKDVWGEVGESDEETALKGIERLEGFIKEIGLKTSLREMGISKDCFDQVAKTTNSLKSFPVELGVSDFLEILNESY